MTILQKRHRPAAATVVVAAIGAALAVWTARRLDITAALGLRAAVLLALFLVPWGLALARAVDTRLLRPGERVVLAVLLGYPAGATVYYLLARLQAAWAFAPLSLVVAIALLARPRRGAHVQEAPDERPAGTAPPLALALVVPLILFTLTRWNRALVPVDGGLAYPHSTDHSLHLAFYWELLRGVPPAQIPAAAGVPFPTYHFLSFMPGLFLAHAGLPVVTLYHAVSPLLKVTLLMAAVYLAVRVRTRDARAATAALLAVFFVDYAFELRFNERMVVGPPPHYDAIRNEAEGGGLLVWAIIALLVVLHDRVRASPESVGGPATGRLLVGAGALAGLSYAFKAQVFLLFGAAFALALALLFLRDRSRVFVLALAAMSLAFVALFALSRAGPSTATVQWRPGLFADMYIYPNLRRDPSRGIDTALLHVFETIPAGLGFLLAVPFAIWRIAAFSPLVPAYVVDVARRARVVGPADAFFALVFLLAVPMGYGFSVVSLYEQTSPFEFRQAAHGLALLGAAVTVAVVHALLERRGRDGGRWVLAASVVASAAVAPFLAGAKPYVPARAGIVVGPDEQCALLFLRHHAPADAVVASVRTPSFADLRSRSMRLNHQAVVSGFAGRRAVLEFYGGEVDWRNDRERDLRRLFTTSDAKVADKVLERYAVDYVMESDALKVAFPRTRLETAYERGSWRVYRVKRGNETAPMAAVPGPTSVTAGGDLACVPPP